DSLTTGGFNDWYLPSITELIILMKNFYPINRTLNATAGATEINQYLDYWSSTETNASSVWGFRVISFAAGLISKSAGGINTARAIRAF
ncbi:MAG TPA: hypothetical protein VFN30_03785, partial [Chitinophagaceae bacterium]|nr:hypothetical protein [Chitinophagaceae bacterium]